MTPERMKLVENFIVKEGPEEVTFQEMQAIVHMLYSIYIFTVLAPTWQREAELEQMKKKGGTKNARRYFKGNSEEGL